MEQRVLTTSGRTRILPTITQRVFWEIGRGKFVASEGTFRVAVHIWPDKDGKLTGTLDSVDEDTNDIGITSISFNQPDLHFTVPSIEGAYQAKLNAEKSGDRRHLDSAQGLAAAGSGARQQMTPLASLCPDCGSAPEPGSRQPSSFCGQRPCQVPTLRSDRPRAGGE